MPIGKVTDAGMVKIMRGRIEKFKSQIEQLERQHTQEGWIRVARKPPDYMWAWTGNFIVKLWCKTRKWKPASLEMLILLSYSDYLLLADMKYWVFDTVTKSAVYTILKGLVEQKYAMVCPVPGGGVRKRHSYVITDAGRAIEADFEKFYDKQLAEMTKNGKFERTAYLKRQSEGKGYLPVAVDKRFKKREKK